MRAFLAIAAYFVLGLAWTSEACAAGAAAAKPSIRIDYGWGGLGPSRHESIEIAREGDGFQATAVMITEVFGPSESRPEIERASYKIPASAIEALIAALRAPPMTKAEGLAALSEPKWLRDNAAAAYKSIVDRPCSNEARDLYIARFQDPVAIRAALDKYFTGMWTDDHPWARIEGKLKPVGKFDRSTGSQKAFMIPWRKGDREDWNPALGRAVAALLPDTSAGKGRLAGAYLLDRVADYVRDDIQSEWANLELRCVHRDLIALLKPKYEVAGIYGYSGPFSGYLRSADMPSNLAVNAILPADEKRGERKSTRSSSSDRSTHSMSAHSSPCIPKRSS